MAELLFPMAAVLMTVGILIPALTVVGWMALRWRRTRTRSWASFGSDGTFALLIAPTLIPIAWLTSSALRGANASRAAESCLLEHVGVDTCVDTAVLLGFLFLGISSLVGFRLWRDRPGVQPEALGGHDSLVARVRAIASAHPDLRSLRITVARCAATPVYTVGLLRPQVVIDACFLRRVDDDMLRATLLHEHAHIARFDTLRDLVARLCLYANPAGALLRPDFERWRDAREALCDSEAVHRGCDPMALAESILSAARHGCGGALPTSAAALCEHTAATLKLRIALLMEGPSAPRRTHGYMLLLIALVAVATLPHIEGFGLLEYVHLEVERLIHRG